MPAYPVFGGAVLPLTTLTDGVFVDPAQEELIGLIRAVLEDTFKDTLDVAVADVLPVEPSASVLLTRKCSFPLLAVYRCSPNELLDEVTDLYQTHWNIQWIMGPMSTDEQLALAGARTWALAAIMGAIRAGGHSAYKDGAAVLKQYFHKAVAKQFDFADMLLYVPEEGRVHPTLNVSLHSREYLLWNIVDLEDFDTVEPFPNATDFTITDGEDVVVHDAT